ncbi:protein kinase domain-containing protein [Thermogemmatispora sp.]|uniref:protein kinase domain-containing protein n=1 Tax=Thermogemmatispora sp. TaxID=1968838 RepID=UPI001D908D40|nr:protein kinase [Thermogemmatispora sp.]MBX5450498.1 FHA domain-containing protein [Thermogemmatispora sp.]
MPALREGQRFERYRVIKLLGSGVAGESYEAEDTLLLRKVVLKLLHPWAPLSDAARRQFFREMQGISQLTHRYLAPVLDYGELHGSLYVARRLFSSGSLLNSDGRLWFSPPLELSAAVSYAHQLAQALQHIHNAGYLHGGLTLANIMVLRGPNVEGAPDHAPFMLADTGLAHFVRRFGRLLRPVMPVTAAPEQLGGRATQASDQFALAVIVYTWLAGRPPYLGLPEEIAQAKLSESFPSLLSLNPQMPLEVEGIIRRALSVYPEDRYPSVLAFADALRQVVQRLAASSVQPTPATPAEEQPREAVAAPAASEQEALRMESRPPHGQTTDESQPSAVAGEAEPAAAVGPMLAAALAGAEVTSEQDTLPSASQTQEQEQVIIQATEDKRTGEATSEEQAGVTLLVAEAEMGNGSSLHDGRDGQPAMASGDGATPLLPEAQPEPVAGEQRSPDEEGQPDAVSVLRSVSESQPAPEVATERTREGPAVEATAVETAGGDRIVSGSEAGSALTYLEALLQATRPSADASQSVTSGQSDVPAAAPVPAVPALSSVEMVAPAPVAAGQEGQDKGETGQTEAVPGPADGGQAQPGLLSEGSLLEVLSGLHPQPHPPVAAESLEQPQSQEARLGETQTALTVEGSQAESEKVPTTAVAAEIVVSTREDGESGETAGTLKEGEEQPAECPGELSESSALASEALADDPPAYVLVLPPATAARPATLVELAAAEITIGRAGDSGILLEGDRRVSRRHAFLKREGRKLLILDGDNAEGVFVNGQRLAQKGSQVLQIGDHIRIGDHELIICRSREEAQQVQRERGEAGQQADSRHTADAADSSSATPSLER